MSDNLSFYGAFMFILSLCVLYTVFYVLPRGVINDDDDDDDNAPATALLFLCFIGFTTCKRPIGPWLVY